ncbi:MAG: TIGR02266 family protein [Myxococcota bacterium]
MSRGRERRTKTGSSGGGERRTGERRIARRIPIELWVEEKSDRELYFQHAANISEGGLFLERTIPRPTGTIVTLEFTLPDAPAKVRVRGEIANSGGDGEQLGMGVRFVDLDDSIRARIRRLIERESDGK